MLTQGGVMTNDRRSLARTPWTTVSTRPIYANQWIRVREDIAEVPDGRRTIYGVVETKPAIGVLPFLDEASPQLSRDLAMPPPDAFEQALPLALLDGPDAIVGGVVVWPGRSWCRYLQVLANPRFSASHGPMLISSVE